MHQSGALIYLPQPQSIVCNPVYHRSAGVIHPGKCTQILSTTSSRCVAGLLVLLDQPNTVNISSYRQSVTLEQPGCGARGRTCDFVQLPNPYSSMWLLSRQRLRHFIATPYWRCASGPILCKCAGVTEQASSSSKAQRHLCSPA